jgi:hypothetical protein
VTEAERALIEAALKSDDMHRGGGLPLYGFAQKVAQERLPADVVTQYKQLIREHIVAASRMHEFERKLPGLALHGQHGLNTKLWDEVTTELCIDTKGIR